MNQGPYRDKAMKHTIELTQSEIFDACREWMRMNHPDCANGDAFIGAAPHDD